MDAQSLTPESTRELDDLRKRAYGPDADILRDPDALRRLHELEAQVRADEPAPTFSAAAPAQTAPQDPASAAAAEPPTAMPHPASPAPTGETPAIRGASPPRRWWRRVPVWGWVAAVGVAGVIVGVASSASLTPRADTTLAPIGHMQPGLEATWALSVEPWLTNDTPPVQHESLDKLRVLSATSAEGVSCLVVTWPSNWSDVSCTPQGLTPVVDFVAYRGGPQPLDTPLAEGTVIRFELHGDVVDVTMREAPPARTSAESP